MLSDLATPTLSPWKRRFELLLDRLPVGEEIEAERLVVRVNPPSFDAMAAEIVKRASAGSLSAVYRVFSPTTRIPLRDFNFDVVVPSKIEDDWAGETVDVDFSRNVELIVSKPQAQ